MNAAQAARRAGITYRQLDHWCRRGWISPHCQQLHGRGNTRELTRAELQRINRMAALVHAGMRPEIAAAALDRAIEDNGHAVIVIVTGPVTITVEAV